MIDALNLRRVYAEIIRGYSTESWDGQTIYLKHLCHFDQVDIDLYYEEALARAKERGIPTEAANVKWLEEQGLWVRKDESALTMQKSYVENLEKTKNKMFLKVQIDDMQRQINSGREELYKMMVRKVGLIGLTCEQVAEQKIQLYYVYLSAFRDAKMTERVFSMDQINQLDEDESNALMDLYISSSRRFGHDALRKIAVSGYFTNYFYVCGENIASFFNRPIAELSMHQINLLSYALYYKRILSTNNVPDEMRDNPDKLEEYVMKTANFKEATAKAGQTGNRVGLVGATQADFDALNLKNSSDVMHNAAQKQYTNAMDAAKDMGIDFRD